MLQFTQFLTEMEKLPKLVTDKLGDYIDMNAAARARRSSNITYQDDQRYNDHEGIQWLNVKNRDFYTIAAAVITGMYDTGKINSSIDIDAALSSKESIDKYLSRRGYEKSLVDKVWNFLKQYMNKGTVTVYRGLELTQKLIPIIQQDPYILYNPARMLQYVDNTTKEFNSFSTHEAIATNFATQFASLDTPHILFSAEVDNNDVNWAFTAYLDGRHGSINEYELNINNLKRLKNIKVLSYSGGMLENVMKLQRVRNNIKKVNNLQNAIGLTVYPVSDDAAKSKFFIFTYKEIPFDKFYICDSAGRILIDELFENIKPIRTDQKLIYVSKNVDESNILNTETGKLLFPEYFAEIVPTKYSKKKYIVKYYEDDVFKVNVYDLTLQRKLFDEDLRMVYTAGYTKNNVLLYCACLCKAEDGAQTIFLNSRTGQRIFEKPYGDNSQYLDYDVFKIQPKNYANVYYLGFLNGQILNTVKFKDIRVEVSDDLKPTKLIKLVNTEDKINYLDTTTNKILLPEFVEQYRITSITDTTVDVQDENDESTETYEYNFET